MQAFSQWRSQVKLAFCGGEATEAVLLAAVKDYARAILVRDTESDLALSRSYEKRFADAAVDFCGARFTLNTTQIRAAVKALMPVDNDVAGASSILDNAIDAGASEVAGCAAQFDQWLLDAAIELQRLVPMYQLPHRTPYYKAATGVEDLGFMSRVRIPSTAHISQVWYGRYYPALEPDVLYEVDDIVISNGRSYKVLVGGELTIYDMASGLQTTDGSTEVLGDVQFAFISPDRLLPAKKLRWEMHEYLSAGDRSGTPGYTISPELDYMYLYPGLSESHQFVVDWVGIAESFADVDDVKFDTTAAEAAAAYIRSKTVLRWQGDRTAAADQFSLFQRAVRKAVLDSNTRETGLNPMSVPYYWRRLGSTSVVPTSAVATTMKVNDYRSATNSTGTSSFAWTAQNTTLGITITGAASTRTIVLQTASATKGDQVTVMLALPATSGIAIDFRTGSASGAQILPSAQFDSSVFTTDGVVPTAMFEFVYDGSAWQYISSSIPA